jgi:DNA topoisomerase-1
MADSVSSAKAAGLRYAVVAEPGISRQRRGKGFVYRNPQGRIVKDAKTLARIRALVLPPAWTEVWIATDPRAHLQATGRDAADRKQYRYHSMWTAQRDSTKYHRLLAFAEVLPAIRRRTRRDLMGPACCRPRVLATVVELLARTYIRIGNEEYARKHQSHGLTTLQDRHVKIRGGKMHFAFRGKSGVFQSIEIEEPRLAIAVRQCQDLPGQTLFQYIDDAKKRRILSSSDINAYLKDVTGGKFTAKDFRTWAGTLAAAQALDAMETPSSKTTTNRSIVLAVDRVAGMLGNTRAVCRKCYIHPAVLHGFADGVTLSRVPIAKSRVPKGLLDTEARLVSLLRRPDRARKAA